MPGFEAPSSKLSTRELPTPCLLKAQGPSLKVQEWVWGHSVLTLCVKGLQPGCGNPNCNIFPSLMEEAASQVRLHPHPSGECHHAASGAALPAAASPDAESEK